MLLKCGFVVDFRLAKSGDEKSGYNTIRVLTVSEMEGNPCQQAYACCVSDCLCGFHCLSLGISSWVLKFSLGLYAYRLIFNNSLRPLIHEVTLNPFGSVHAFNLGCYQRREEYLGF